MLHTLEQNRSFGTIAWFTVIGLSCVVMWLVAELEEEMSKFETNRDYTEAYLEEHA